MTREELCRALQTPDDTPAGGLLAAWHRRRSEIGVALALDSNAKPVKLRLRDELRRLESAEELAGQLRLVAEIDRYLAEFTAEESKSNAAAGVLRLCLEKATQLVPQISDSDLRFACEKKVERVAPAFAEPSAGRPNALKTPTARKPAHADECPPGNAPPSILELHPFPAEETLRRPLPTIRLVAGPRFTLGRQSAADLIARFLPDTEENQRKTSTISRINTTLFVRGRQICVQDGQIGEGTRSQPSRNGTLIDEQRVLGAIPLNFTKERRFKLGQYGFEVNALHLPGSCPAGPFPGGEGNPPAAHPAGHSEHPSGCVRFQTAASAPVITLWILSEVALGSGPDAAVVFDRSLPPVAARIHFWEGQFWLEVPSEEKSVLALDGRPRPAGDVVPLHPDQELRVGPQRFSIRSA